LHGMSVTDGANKGWVIGADTTDNKCYEVDISVDPNAWTPKTNITTPRTSASTYQARVIYYDGKIYVIGGYVGAAVSNKNEALDPVANTWATLAAITTPRYDFGIAQDAGLIYCIGGKTTAAAYTPKNEAYDPVGDGWTSLTDLPTTPSAGGTIAVALNGYIWLLSKDAGAVKFYRYDPGTDAYASKTAPVDSVRLASLAANGVTYSYERLWAFDGYIWLSAGKYLFRYSIADNAWVCVSETFFCYEYTNPSDGNKYVLLRMSNEFVHGIMQFGDRRWFFPHKYTAGYYSYWYTYYMYLGQVSADKILAFRQRSSADIDLCNISSQTAGEAIYTMSTDKWGIYYDYYKVSPIQVIQIYG
jgi:hypothetical protein